MKKSIIIFVICLLVLGSIFIYLKSKQPQETQTYTCNVYSKTITLNDDPNIPQLALLADSNNKLKGKFSVTFENNSNLKDANFLIPNVRKNYIYGNLKEFTELLETDEIVANEIRSMELNISPIIGAGVGYRLKFWKTYDNEFKFNFDAHLSNTSTMESVKNSLESVLLDLGIELEKEFYSSIQETRNYQGLCRNLF